MHEMALAQSVVTAIEEQAWLQSFSRVTRVTLEVGALSCVDAHALEFGFDVVARGTLVEGAALSIHTPEGRAHCFSCERNVPVASKAAACPYCGSHQLIYAQGEELKIKSLEVE